MNTTRKRIWTILRLAILAFLITGIIDIFIVAGDVFHRTVQQGVTIAGLSDRIETKIPSPPPSDDPYDQLDGNAALAENIIQYKRLHIDVDPHRVAVSYDVYLSKSHPLFLAVEGDGGDYRAARLSRKVLGVVLVSDQLVGFDRVETSFVETDDNAHLVVTGAAFQPTRNSYPITVKVRPLNPPLNIAINEILVHTQGVNVVTSSPYIPVSKNEDLTRFVLPANGDDLNLLVEVIDPLPRAEPTPEPRDTLATLLQKQPNIPGLSSLVYGVLEAIPFIVFIFWCRRHESAIPDARSQQEIIKTYLIFHFSYFFFYSFSNLIEDWRNPFMSALSYFERRTLPVFGATDLSNETHVLIPLMVMFFYVWLKLARAYTGPANENPPTWREKGKRILAVLIAVLIFGGLLTFIGWMVMDNFETIRTNVGGLTVAQFYLIFFAVLILALYVVVLVLGQAIRVPKRLGFSLTLFSLLMLMIALDLFYMFANDSGNRYLQGANKVVSFLIFAASALALVWVFAVLTFRAVTGRSLPNAWQGWNGKKRVLLVLVLLAVALSSRYWEWPMKYWPLWWLAWELKDLFFLVLLWFLATFLRRASAQYDWLELPDSVRDAGILLALFLFYRSTSHWNFIPVSFILGYLLLKYWLLPKTQFDRNLLSGIKSGLNRLIERVIAFNDAERALKTLKKELLTKLGSGELDPKQYSEKLSAQIEVVKTCREDLMVRDQFAKDHVLSLGPGNSAWENGYRTAYYSLLFSIPWSLLYLRDIVRSEATGVYLLLDLLTNVVFFLLAWLSYGFIFGYFYPYIRGKNGVRKALALLVTIVVPDLVWTALTKPVDAANWASFGFWTLQVFVHTMLLGIATDFSIMRSQGFKWSHLLEFYRLTSVSAWASSLILAIAAAASTLITSGAAQILTQAFKYVGVIPEDVKLPQQ